MWWEPRRGSMMPDVKIDVYAYSDELKKGWWLLLISGIFSVLIGGLLIFWPGATITVITAVIGLFMVITGVVRFFVAILGSDTQDRRLMVIAGIIGIVLGVLVMKFPEATIGVIVLIVALFWLVSGLVDFFRGLTNEHMPDRTVRIMFGAISVLFGVVILVWPAVTVGVFAVFAGVYSAFFGVLEIVAAFQIKKA